MLDYRSVLKEICERREYDDQKEDICVALPGVCMQELREYQDRTGSPIPGFSEKISVFREAGMSCTLLLQSLSQLDYLYGPYASAVIQENCDTMVFLGNNDLRTCKMISERACIPLEDVLQMKPGEEILIRRGYEAERIQRYQTFEDPVYLSTIEGLEK